MTNPTFDEVIDFVLSLDEKDWRKGANFCGLSPAELEFPDLDSTPEEEIFFQQELQRYRTEIETAVDQMKRDHPWINRDKQIEIYWNCPVIIENLYGK